MSKNSSRRKRQEQKKKQEAQLTGPVLTQQGFHAFKQGRYQQAIEAWEKARRKGDAPARLTEALAEAYFRQGVSAAPPTLAEVAQAVKLRPADPVYRYHLALAHHRLGQLDQAEALYRQLMATQPPYERAAEPLAQLLIEQKKPLAKDSVWSHLGLSAKAQLAAAEALLRGKADSTLHRLTEAPLEPVWRGLLGLALGDKAIAQQNFQAGLAATPPLSPLGQGVAHYYLGVLAAESGQFEAANSHWQMAQATGLKTPQLRQNLSALAYRQAVAAQQAGRPQEAQQWLAQISRPGTHLDLTALSGQINWELGYAAAQQGRWEQALTNWQAVAQTGADSRPLLLNLALAYQKTNHPFEAAERWRELLRRRPRKADHPDALNDEQVARIWQNVAENYNLAGQYDQAVTTYKTALKWAPDNLALRLKFVEAQQAAGRWQAAENELNRLLAQHPQHVPALVMLAEMYAEDYYPERARRLWSQILELEPQHPVARQQLAHLYEREGAAIARWGNLERALEIYQEGLAQFPDSQRLHLVVGQTYARQKDFDQARHYFDRALALKPNDLATLHDIFVVWLNQGLEADLNSSIDRIKAVQEFIPGSFFTDLIDHCLEADRKTDAQALLDYAEVRYADDEATLLDLAMQRAELGQEEHAASLLRRILKDNPDNALAEVRLGAIYYKTGQTRLANRHWDKAQQQAQREGNHELLYELKVIKDMLVYGQRPPQSPLEMLRSMPPQLRQQMINQLPPELAAVLNKGGVNILDALMDIAMSGDFLDDEEDDDDYYYR